MGVRVAVGGDELVGVSEGRPGLRVAVSVGVAVGVSERVADGVKVTVTVGAGVWASPEKKRL